MDYISREDAIKALTETCDTACPYSKNQRYVMCASCRFDDALTIIEDLPAADVVGRNTLQHSQHVESVENALDVPERNVGKWLPVQGYNNNVLYCSCCNSEVMGKTHTRNFCPNCGADMREDDNGKL